jgi:hypothetical protein
MEERGSGKAVAFKRRSLTAGLWDAAVDREQDAMARLRKAAHHWEDISSQLDDYEDVEEDEDG